MIDDMQDEARSLLSIGEYAHALAEFSVLREIRARREGPYSPRYLDTLHDCLRCMSHLSLWSDASTLCGELHGKYMRTHGRTGPDTVDVAKHWAWALVHLNDTAPAVRLYLATADALWDVDHDQAHRLLGAALAHSGPMRPETLVADGSINGVGLRHGDAVIADLTSQRRHMPDLSALGATAFECTTIDGLIA